jgi:hypothetical protein
VTLPSGERWAVAGKVGRYIEELKNAAPQATVSPRGDGGSNSVNDPSPAVAAPGISADTYVGIGMRRDGKEIK